MARCLLGAGPVDAVMEALSAANTSHLQDELYVDFVLARLPLTGDAWALVPLRCPGLGRALPVALAHSPQQAWQLMWLLPTADQERLHTLAWHGCSASLTCPCRRRSWVRSSPWSCLMLETWCIHSNWRRHRDCPPLLPLPPSSSLLTLDLEQGLLRGTSGLAMWQRPSMCAHPCVRSHPMCVSCTIY